MKNIKDLFETDEKDELVDSGIEEMREVIGLFSVWNDLNIQFQRVKTLYKLSQKWDDEDLAKQHLATGEAIMKKLDVVEEELKPLLPSYKGTKAFTVFSTDQVRQMAVWMKEMLEI